MIDYIRKPAEPAGTITFNANLQPAPSADNQQNRVGLSHTPAANWDARIIEFLDIHYQDSCEDNEEEAWQAYLELESRYSGLSRMLADY